MQSGEPKAKRYNNDMHKMGVMTMARQRHKHACRPLTTASEIHLGEEEDRHGRMRKWAWADVEMGMGGWANWA